MSSWSRGFSGKRTGTSLSVAAGVDRCAQSAYNDALSEDVPYAIDLTDVFG